jgi:hypothetical protein
MCVGTSGRQTQSSGLGTSVSTLQMASPFAPSACSRDGRRGERRSKTFLLEVRASTKIARARTCVCVCVCMSRPQPRSPQPDIHYLQCASHTTNTPTTATTTTTNTKSPPPPPLSHCTITDTLTIAACNDVFLSVVSHAGRVQFPNVALLGTVPWNPSEHPPADREGAEAHLDELMRLGRLPWHGKRDRCLRISCGTIDVVTRPGSAQKDGAQGTSPGPTV